MEGRIDAAEAFAASQLDESFQIEEWGEDAEASARRKALAEDIAAAAGETLEPDATLETMPSVLFDAVVVRAPDLSHPRRTRRRVGRAQTRSDSGISSESSW